MYVCNRVFLLSVSRTVQAAGGYPTTQQLHVGPAAATRHRPSWTGVRMHHKVYNGRGRVAEHQIQPTIPATQNLPILFFRAEHCFWHPCIHGPVHRGGVGREGGGRQGGGRGSGDVGGSREEEHGRFGSGTGMQLTSRWGGLTARAAHWRGVSLAPAAQERERVSSAKTGDCE